jgi:hypothetical protein
MKSVERLAASRGLRVDGAGGFAATLIIFSILFPLARL